MAATEPDPVYAAIEAHRVLQAAAEAHSYRHGGDDIPDNVNPVRDDWDQACMAACDAARIVMDVKPTTVAGVAAALAYFAAANHEVLPDIVLADTEEHVRFGGGLIAWAARSLERLAGGTNV
jgi:hypothetical protein